MRMRVTQIPRIITTSVSVFAQVCDNIPWLRFRKTSKICEKRLREFVASELIRENFDASRVPQPEDETRTKTRRKTRCVTSQECAEKDVRLEIYKYTKLQERHASSQAVRRKMHLIKITKNMYHIAPNTSISTAFRVV